MESQMDYWTARALLEWQVEAGADEAIGDTPVDRYALDAKAPPVVAKPEAEAPSHVAVEVDPVGDAERAAQSAASLEELAAAMQSYPHCELRRGARNFVFCDGRADARVMIVGEAPGRDEDLEGRPFVGRAGQLLDKMLAAIDLSRQAQDAGQGVYITNVLPWRPPSNRTPEQAEIDMMVPFVRRHVALAKPEVLILMGNTPCQALLGKTGITRMRGGWVEVDGIPTMPMFHPAYLLRQAAAKREAWADLLSLRARLNG